MKPLRRILPYDTCPDLVAGERLKAYYERGEPPTEPLLLALLQRTDINGLGNPYRCHPADIHRWIQQHMPKRVWGTRQRVERWCDALENT